MSRKATFALLAILGLSAGCRNGSAPEDGQNVEALPIIQPASGGEMVLLPAGSFMMGDKDGGPDQAPHSVSVNAFYIDKWPVTQEIYEKIMGVNPSKQRGPKNPVERMQWTEAAGFCNKCSELEGLTPCYNPETWACNFAANGYRLPTEAEWEYACRAGGTGKYLLRRLRGRTGPLRLVQAAIAGRPAPRRSETAQPLGPLRHARQRLAVVQRLVQRQLLRREPR